MGRNKLIYGLSRATLVIASAKDKGGTWAGATEATKKGYGTVAVWMGAGAGPGNSALVQQGATPVEEPEAVLDLAAVRPRTAESDRQMAFSLEATSAKDARVLDEASAILDPSDGQVAAPVPDGFEPTPAPQVAPQPTGTCWCGCGKAVEENAFFLPRHAPGAVQRAVVKHFGSAESFLLMLGEAPSPDPEA